MTEIEHFCPNFPSVSERSCKLSIFLIYCRGHPLVGVRLEKEKSVGICIGYRPTIGGFSHCPIKVGRQLQKPTPVYAIDAFGYISPEIPCRKQDNHISTGIYRCSILDFDMKLCENFQWSRISADKRFFMYVHYIPLRLTPDRMFVRMNFTQLAWSARRSAIAKLIIFFEI